MWNMEGHHIPADQFDGPNKNKQEQTADLDQDLLAGISNKKSNAQPGNSTKTCKARKMTIVESGTRDSGIDVLFKDQNEYEDNSESNDGEKASPPNRTRIKSNNMNKGKNPSCKSQPKNKKGKQCQGSKGI
jgi:hypothetical protein